MSDREKCFTSYHHSTKAYTPDVKLQMQGYFNAGWEAHERSVEPKLGEVSESAKTIKRLWAKCDEKDTKIAELEKTLRSLNRMDIYELGDKARAKVRKVLGLKPIVCK